MPARKPQPFIDFRSDLASVPFSRYGSWWNLFEPPRADLQPLGPGLYLRCNRMYRAARREILRLELLAADGVRPHQARALPHVLELHDRQGGGVIETLMVGPAGVLMRGVGVGLRLRASAADGHIAHVTADGRVVSTQHDTQRRYVVEAWGATLSLTFEPSAGARAAVIDVIPNGDEPWTLTIEEAGSSWPARKADRQGATRPDFDAEARKAQREWETFRAAFGAAPRRWADAVDFAVHILWSFTAPPDGLLTRPTVLMARGWMDAIWSWDNWFNMCGLAGAHPKLALDQVLLMAEHQDEFGAYPDVVCPPYKFYSFTKPPVQGVLLRWLREKTPEFLTRPVTRALYPTTAEFTRFFLEQRRWPGRRLCHYLHGYDSGWDNCTMFDAGAPLEAPDINAMMVIQAEELARMADELGKKRDAVQWRSVADEFCTAIVEELWDGDGFAAYVIPKQAKWRCRSLVCCMPLILGERLPAGHRKKLIAEVRGLMTPHGLATEPTDSPEYDSDGYWRGPVWGVSTLLTVVGLERCGQKTLARDIARRFCDTCAQSGFAENFDALTGERRRDPAYSWTASTFLALLRHTGA